MLPVQACYSLLLAANLPCHDLPRRHLNLKSCKMLPRYALVMLIAGACQVHLLIVQLNSKHSKLQSVERFLAHDGLSREEPCLSRAACLVRPCKA